ncbi:MAG: type II secretion system F family protein [Proteobacteria bacterium]|nr:type II secretion system F family protein [Pseudomonadota bacterium]
MDIISYIIDPRFMGALFTAVAVGATVITIGLPLMDRNQFKNRMKTVAIERENIRQRERERMNTQGKSKVSLRSSPKSYMKNLVENFDLKKHAASEDLRMSLASAGFRGNSAEYTFLFFRMVAPILLFVFTSFYVFVVLDLKQPATIKVAICIAGAYIGFKAPEIYLTNLRTKRKQNMQRAFPDSLDLLLICVESGMSVEHSFKRVSTEIVAQSMALAEELALMTAELSYLPDRRIAYENLAKRTGMDSVKSVCTALVQAEKYGTPVGQALRTLAQESRDMRMNEAEKKAAALPPKLTVPMIVFFLPVLFIVILTPALVQVFHWK